MEQTEHRQKKPKQSSNAKKTKTSKKPQKAKKKQSANEKFLSVLKTISILAIVFVLLMVAAKRFGDITFSSVGDYFNTLISGVKSGDGYPYLFDHQDVKKVLSVGNELFVLTADETYTLDTTARTIGKAQHSYSAPIAVTAGGRTLLLDVGEQNYRVQSKTDVLYEGTFPQKLLNGAISKSGHIALASRGAHSQTMLTVLNKHQKEIFTWSCATENIVALAISDNGKRVAASVVGAEDGELYSKVYVFDIHKKDPLLCVNYQDVIPYVTFLQGNRVLVAGNNVFDIYTGNEPTVSEDLQVNTFSRMYTSENKYTLAVFAKYGSSSTQIVKAYDKKGELLFTTELQDNVKGVSTDGTTFSVLSDTALYHLNRDGELLGKIPVEAGCVAPFTKGKQTYVWTVGGIERFKTTYSAENVETQTTEPISLEDSPFSEPTT